MNKLRTEDQAKYKFSLLALIKILTPFFYYNINSMKILLLIALLAVSVITGPVQDIVHYPIPGYNHTWYSGYLEFNTGRYHYVFFESQKDPDNDPINWWFNGGPGCSSMFGMLYEHGPFVFKTNSINIMLNEWAWNKESSVLYIETPGGVGFSESRRNNTYSDETATQDNLKALRKFYEKFPTLKKNELYISGESYAGVYVPFISKAILDFNKLPTRELTINLKGFLVNNPCTDPQECYIPRIAKSNSIFQYKYLYNHGFLTEKQYDDMAGACSLGYNSPDCARIRKGLDEKFESFNTSIFNIYDTCYYQNLSLSTGVNTQYKLTQSGGQLKLNGGLSCEDEIGMHNWLNEPVIRRELHVNVSKHWTNCNGEVSSRYQKNPEQSYPLYKELIKQKLRIWVVSGDHDADVPITGTLTWLEQLRDEASLAVEYPWNEWWVKGVHKYEDQVGGMTWGLKGLKFVSIRGAGHMAHRDQRQASWVMIDSFLKGNELPTKELF